MQKDNQFKTAEELFKLLWPVIVVLIAFAVAWGTFSSRLDADDQNIKILNTKQDEILSVETDIATIKQQIIYINQKLGQ